MDTWYLLKQDKVSVFHNIGVEGKAGDAVKMVYDSYPACIVENEHGYRFATRHDNLKDVTIPIANKSAHLNTINQWQSPQEKNEPLPTCKSPNQKTTEPAIMPEQIPLVEKSNKPAPKAQQLTLL